MSFCATRVKLEALGFVNSLVDHQNNACKPVELGQQLRLSYPVQDGGHENLKQSGEHLCSCLRVQGERILRLVLKYTR